MFKPFHTSCLLLPEPSSSRHLKLSTYKDISSVDSGPFPKTETITLNPETTTINPEIEITTLNPETTITLGASSETEITAITARLRVDSETEAEISPRLDTDSSDDDDDDPNIIPGSLLHSIDRKVIKDVIEILVKKTPKIMGTLLPILMAISCQFAGT